MTGKTCLLVFLSFLLFKSLPAQELKIDNWTYIAVDSSKQKWGDWDEPEWLRYFGLDFGDVNRDGLKDMVSGRYVYLNPGGDLMNKWERIALDDNVDAILIFNIDDDPFADIIAQALPDLYWYEALDEAGTTYRKRVISQIPATSHVNSQGFERGQIIPGGKEEILIAGDGNVYCIQIPEDTEADTFFPTYLIGKNTSDEGIGIGDIDGDGDNDISCGRRPENEYEPKIAVWFENPGNLEQEWEDHIIGHSDHPLDRFEVADLDKDGKAEVIITEERYPGLEPDANLYLFTQEDGEWRRRILVTQYSMNNLDIGDIDKDGDQDIITNEHKGSKLELQIWENDGQANFTKKTIDTGKENHLGSMLVDLDNDGDLDIAGAAWDHYQWMHVWRNNALGLYSNVSREYHWVASNEMEGESFLRVGGKLDYISYPAHFKKKKSLRKGAIRIAENIDLENAIAAELVLEKVQSHDDTRNLQIQINRKPWMAVPEPKTIPDSAASYMYHFNPKVHIPLNYLKSGKVDLKLKVDPDQRWGWPQNIFYGFTLRVYYNEEVHDKRFSIEGIDDGDTLSHRQKLRISSLHLGDIKAVEYIGFYEDVNWQGDGIYRQWQAHSHQCRMRRNIASSNSTPFEIEWDTQWIPDQDRPINLMAKIELEDGRIHYSNIVRDLSLIREQSVLLLKPYHVPKNWATREAEYSESVYLPVDPSLLSEVILYWKSWSPCYSEGLMINGTKINRERDMPCYAYYEHSLKLDDLSPLRRGQNTISTLLTPLKEGHMVHGMEVQWPGIQVKAKLKAGAKSGVVISETEYEGRDHLIIKTETLTYYYDKSGGGFSRMIDSDGKDWISFRMDPWGEYPAAAGGAFRGIPNLVYGGDDGGAGHPGHDKCTSRIEGNTIVSESISGKWKWRWSFDAEHARMDILQTDPASSYWFLYEGTPGGSFRPGEYYYGSSSSIHSEDIPDFYKGESEYTNYQWIYVGSARSGKTFYMAQQDEDESMDMYGFLGNTEAGLSSEDGMTVFGFGRSEDTQALLQGPHSFIFGLYPGSVSKPSDHEAIAGYISEKLHSISEPTFPGNEWQISKPEEQGMDKQKMQEALNYLASHSRHNKNKEVLIIRNGFQIYGGENIDSVHNIWSCSKTFTSTVLGLLVDDGLVKLDDRVAEYEPLLRQYYNEVSFRHFTTMTSGYSAEGDSRWENTDYADWSWTVYKPEEPLFAPGTAFAYWDEAQMMFGRSLTQVLQEEMHSFLKRRVTDPIGMGDWNWYPEKEVKGIPINNGCTNVFINAQQFARWGWLFLNEGNWDGKQLISKDWIRCATSVQVPSELLVGDTDRKNTVGSGCYGFNWWVNGRLSSGKLKLPGAPEGCYFASGLNNNKCIVIPQWNMVIVRMGEDGHPDQADKVYGEFLRLLEKAIIKAGANHPPGKQYPAL